ncbi:hypothetical protein Tco_0764316 [Tanacetum coccineum]
MARHDVCLLTLSTYASSMPPIFSLPLYMACDDGDGLNAFVCVSKWDGRESGAVDITFERHVFGSVEWDCSLIEKIGRTAEDVGTGSSTTPLRLRSPAPVGGWVARRGGQSERRRKPQTKERGQRGGEMANAVWVSDVSISKHWTEEPGAAASRVLLPIASMN